MSRKVAFTPGASVLPVSAREKMPNLEKRFDRNFVFIRVDTAVRVYMQSSVIEDEASLASESPG
jgi:hypothetical protein